MARIRTIKPSFWSDDDVASLSRDARLLLVGLISMADDDGRFVATHESITGYVFPYDGIRPKVLTGWLGEIADRGILELYTVSGRPYGHLPNFRHGKQHQRINRPQESSLPTPPSLNGSVNRSRSRS